MILCHNCNREFNIFDAKFDIKKMALVCPDCYSIEINNLVCCINCFEMYSQSLMTNGICPDCIVRRDSDIETYIENLSVPIKQSLKIMIEEGNIENFLKDYF